MLERLRSAVEADRLRTGKRRQVTLVDGTLRDAHQCLWATRMRTEHMLPIAETLDSAGFQAVEAIAMVGFDACLRYLNEDPIERVRLLATRMPNTPLRAALRSNLLHSFVPQPEDVNEFYVERMIANGITEFVVLDCLHSWDNVAHGIATARSLGASVTVWLMYNIAPGYDDDFYVRQAREVISRFGVEAICLYDAGGILTVERTRTLVPAVRAVIGETRLELATHCLTGVGPLVCLEAAVLGVDSILSAVDPLANGNSLVAAQSLIRDLRTIGIDVDVDVDALDHVGGYLGDLAAELGMPVGVPAEYSPDHYRSQYAGGAMTNMESQLRQAGIHHRLPEVMAEIASVRLELGSPVMGTPFPAIVAAQAVVNVVEGQRYSIVLDEVKKYACGYYGTLPIAIDGNVLDRIMTNGSSTLPATPPQLQPALPGLRERYGALSPDELLLRFMYDSRVDTIQPANQAFRLQRTVLDVLDSMAKGAQGRSVRFEDPMMKVVANV